MRPAKLSSVAAGRSRPHGDAAAAKRVFDTAGEAIRALSEALDGAFSRAVDVLFATSGRVIVSGMGKSGHIGRKIAATLASTGTPAQFIHPAEASHGDLGALTAQDALLMLSWRGETAELSDLITYAKRFRIPLIGMASNAESTLLQAADVALVIPPVREACPMGLAPTTSTTTMLVLGDALAVALMERRGFSADQYRQLHPGGSLGRALIRVSDLMHAGEEMPLVADTTSMQRVLIAIAEHRLGCVGVVDRKGALVGIITDGDLRRHMGRDLLDRKASEIMTRSPKIARPDQLAAEALALMNEKKITQLFVLGEKDRGRKPLGVLHIHDCLKAGLQ
ncbi:MAG TPA: KpsF/GutQ family sugar-phosphate isomerase [Rhizomicrobium sp.]|jgi:arabinose-5-phosphate isomerase|nr:KpsF/GutQ family sugar-phosphate isomerase [Rhizomicrobium sp.]